MKEARMSYYEQIGIIKNYGKISDLVKDEKFLSNLILNNFDRHIVGTFLDLVNEGISSGEIVDEDLTLLRSGFMVKKILDLPLDVQTTGRSLFPFEMGDKINYLSSIKDTETLNATYTNERLIYACSNSKTDEINYWINSGTIYGLPMETKIEVANAFIKNGNIEKGTKLLDSISSSLKKVREYQKEDNMEQRQR